MGEEKMGQETNLLDVDLEAIVEEGKRKSKKKRRNFVIAAVALVAVAIAMFFINRETTYQKAVAAQDAGNYETATLLFEKTGNYKDSKEQLTDTQFAEDFRETFESFSEINNRAFANSRGYGIDIRYDVHNREVVMKDTISEKEEEEFLAEQIKPKFLAMWCSMCSSLDSITENAATGFSFNGYDVDCRFVLLNGGGETLYSTTNGVVTESRIEGIEEAVAAAYEELYSQMVALVDGEKYQEAYEYWNDNCGDFYTLDYKDLADYYHYANALKDYKKEKPVFVNQVVDALREVSPNFKDTTALMNLYEPVADLDGTYVKPDEEKLFGMSSSLEYQIIVDDDSVRVISWSKYRNEVVADYGGGAMPIAWVIENGKPIYAEIESLPYMWKVTPMSGGLNIEWQTTYDNEIDFSRSGIYTKQS